MLNHESVLLHETVDSLNVQPNGIYVDATFGRGGHTKYLLDQLDGGTVYAVDRDEEAIKVGNELAQKVENESNNQLVMISANFDQLSIELSNHGVSEIDGILYDLGVSSPQLDDADRGFSYRNDARLDMRMDQTQELDAYYIVNNWEFNDLVRILRKYGDEKFAKQIARAIERNRDQKPIETTTELAEIVKSAIPAAARRTGGHPAKKTFQAIRIAVNDEIGSIERSLEQAIDLLKIGGRASVITFQPLEDKVVQRIFKKYSEIDVPRGIPVIPEDAKPKLKIVKKKPIKPTDDELSNNHRSHSAKLRVVEKIND